MREQGYITAQEEREASKQPLAFAPSREAGQVAPYFVEYVKQDLIDTLGAEKVYAGGLRVYTSLDPGAPILPSRPPRSCPVPGDPEVALVSLRPSDGRVLAMIGGRDFKANQFNLAAQGRRQPGSAFKPFVLVTALEQGVRPDQVFETAPYSVPVNDGVWTVQNYENRFTAGTMTLQAATDYSVNGVYARLDHADRAREGGADGEEDGHHDAAVADPAIALGGLKNGVSPLEMASAYAHDRQQGPARPTQRNRHGDRRPGRNGAYARSSRRTRAIPSETAAQAAHDAPRRD